MQHQNDSNDWKSRWKLQKLAWQIQILNLLDEAEALVDEAEALRAMIRLIDSQIEPGPPE